MSILEKVKLKEIREHDLPLVLSWRNKDKIRNVMLNDKKVTWDEHFSWYKNLEGNDDIKVLLFYLNDIPLGIVNIKLDLQNDKCEWGFYIGAENTPKRAGTLLGFMALNYIFEELGVRKVCAEVLNFNNRSITFHDMLGFYKEGILYRHIKRNDEFIDVFLLAIFKEQWKKDREKIKLLLEGMEI